MVRTIDAIDSKTGDTYREYAASLDEPIVVNGVVMATRKNQRGFEDYRDQAGGEIEGRYHPYRRINCDHNQWPEDSAGNGRRAVRKHRKR